MKALWATKPRDLTQFAANRLRRKTWILVSNVSITQLLRRTSDWQRIGKINGESERRIDKIIRAWASGLPLDPPMVYPESDGAISFEDGRHRTYAAKLLGDKKIIVMTPKRTLHWFASLFL